MASGISDKLYREGRVLNMPQGKKVNLETHVEVILMFHAILGLGDISIL